MNIFTDITVLPAYGKNQSVVTWTVSPEYRDAVFTIEKSPDETTWVPIGKVTGDNQFIDVHFVVRDKLTVFFYRVTATKNGHKVCSPSIGTFGKASREDFGIALVLLQEWGLKISQGTKVKIFKQLIHGDVCPLCTDEDTGQQLGTALCEQCFGTGYDRGFASGIDSYMIQVDTPQRSTIDSPDGKGTIDAQVVKARMLAYPSLRRGDMIVKPSSDDRYLVDSITTFDAKGVITVLYDLQLDLLPRNDIRYKVSI